MSVNVRDWFEQRSFSHADFAALGTPGQASREVSTTLIFPSATAPRPLARSSPK